MHELAGISTVVIAVATVVYVVVTIFLWRVTKKSADAANTSANALVNSERAWIMVNLRRNQGGIVEHRNAGKESITISFQVTYKNEGRTPAWVTEKLFKAHIAELTPVTPDLESTNEADSHGVSLEPLGVGQEVTFDQSVTCPGWVSGKNFVVLYGYVKYRDAFGPQRETRFGYEVSGDQKFKRIPAVEFNNFS